MVDLFNQHQKIKTELDEAIQEVINTTQFIQGNKVRSFESSLAKYMDARHVLSCANGTDALQLALMALDLPPGSEVITTDFTFVATAEVIALLGLKPVLVDVDPDTYNIDPNSIETAITSATKVIIPVHLYGQSCDMDAIMNIASRNDLYVIEDTAQAIGSDFKNKNGKTQKSGTISHIGTTSFFPSKNLGCMGDGGALFTNDDQLAAKINMIRNHGQSNQYIYEVIGVNSRLDTIQAAVLEVKLKYLDKYNQARQKAAAFYDEAFKNNEHLKTPVRAEFSTHIFHQYTLEVLNGKRDELQTYLNEKGIPNKVYYPVPLHQHHAYEKSAVFNYENLKTSRRLSKSVISLPMHTELDDEQLNFITKEVNQFFTKK